jgi:hypothetical protein
VEKMPTDDLGKRRPSSAASLSLKKDELLNLSSQWQALFNKTVELDSWGQLLEASEGYHK